MKNKIELTIDLKKLEKSKLPLTYYLLLGFLYHHNEVKSLLKSVIIEDILYDLEQDDYLRLIENEIIINPKTIALFEDKSSLEIDEVIQHFNDLKLKYLKIKKVSKCDTDKSSIAARIKTYNLQTVKDVITLKFNMWKDDYDMKKHLTSMTTMIVNKTFEGYVNKLEMYENNVIIKQSKLV